MCPTALDEESPIFQPYLALARRRARSTVRLMGQGTGYFSRGDGGDGMLFVDSRTRAEEVVGLQIEPVVHLRK